MAWTHAAKSNIWMCNPILYKTTDLRRTVEVLKNVCGKQKIIPQEGGAK